MLKVFPYKYWSTVCTCFVGSIQMAVVGVIMNREKATWELKWNMSLLTIVYSVNLFFWCASVCSSRGFLAWSTPLAVNQFVPPSWRIFFFCCRRYSILLPSLWWFRGSSQSAVPPTHPCFVPCQCSSLQFLTRCFSGMICLLGGILARSPFAFHEF
jgi:hypothetical protein